MDSEYFSYWVWIAFSYLGSITISIPPLRSSPKLTGLVTIIQIPTKVTTNTVRKWIYNLLFKKPFDRKANDISFSWKIISFTDKNTFYFVNKNIWNNISWNNMTCTCPDFKYRGKKKWLCKHINALLMTYASTLVSD